MKFGAVNASQQRYLTWINGVRSVPTIKVFGREKANSSVYNGDDNAKDLINFIDNYAAKHDYN